MSKEMKSGIYIIVCIPTGDSYVGGASNIVSRWGVHRSDLRNNLHHNMRLQFLWNWYGETAFKFDVLERVGVSSLVEREQFYIDGMTPSLNVRRKAQNKFGCRHTDESKRKLREGRMSKPVLQIDLDTGSVIASFPSMKAAARSVGCSQGNILNACRGTYKKAAGYAWKFGSEIAE